MENKRRNSSYQMIVLIATPKLAEQAAEMFRERDLPIQFRLNAEGTASSEIMDTLGFGSIDKGIIVSMVSKAFGRIMLKKLHTDLRLDTINSGIAFTMPLTGATNLLVRMMNSTDEKNELSYDGKGEGTMTEEKYTLIAAITNRGFGVDVMNAARSAGARGGTALHSRAIEDGEAAGFWGLSMQEEREIVLILAEHENKVKIMSAISEKCGMNTPAKGLVTSLPVDAVMGL